MKAFLLSLVAAVGLAAVSGLVLEGVFRKDSDTTFSVPSARVGEEGSIKQRNFSGGQ